MIIVVEGISAAGKTTWIRRFGPDHMVAETGARPDAPDRGTAPAAAADFWVRRNCERWSRAQLLSRQSGLAICDTDPLRLHYVWCLWQIGAASETAWMEERKASRRAVQAAHLGFADIYLIKEITPAQARRQRNADASRTRRSFDLHVSLGPLLRRWYEALETVLPGSVFWTLPEDGYGEIHRAASRERPPATEVFDALVNKVASRQSSISMSCSSPSPSR